MPATRLVVTETSWTTPDVRRVHFRSDDLSGFADSHFTDRYVKLVFPKPGAPIPADVDLRSLRSVMDPEDMPDVRTYTALFPDVEAGTLAIDFVVHGDEGVAGPWAAKARPGDELLANGPGGAYRPNPDVEWHLLVGDESALPALLAAAAELPGDAEGEIVVLVDGPGDEAEVAAPPGIRVTWIYRDGALGDGLLVDAVRALPWREGRVGAFVHGEAEEVMHGLRPLLLSERKVPRADASISGYWRRGRTEAGFREWKHELAEAEGESRNGGGPDGRRGRGGAPSGPGR